MFYSVTPAETGCRHCKCQALTVAAGIIEAPSKRDHWRGEVQSPSFAYIAFSSSSFTVEQSFKCLHSDDSNGAQIEKWGLKSVSADLTVAEPNRCSSDHFLTPFVFRPRRR